MWDGSGGRGAVDGCSVDGRGGKRGGKRGGMLPFCFFDRPNLQGEAAHDRVLCCLG